MNPGTNFETRTSCIAHPLLHLVFSVAFHICDFVVIAVFKRVRDANLGVDEGITIPDSPFQLASRTGWKPRVAFPEFDLPLSVTAYHILNDDSMCLAQTDVSTGILAHAILK